jgi:K+-sensing histidine kinase KdpD
MRCPRGGVSHDGRRCPPLPRTRRDARARPDVGVHDGGQAEQHAAGPCGAAGAGVHARECWLQVVRPGRRSLGHLARRLPGYHTIVTTRSESVPVVPNAPLRYGLAIALTVVALLLSLGLSAWVQESPFSLFLAAVAVSAWYGGLGPGLLATLLGGLICATFFLPPFASPALATITSSIRLVIFLLVAILISSLSATLREARYRAEASRQRLSFLAAASRRLAAAHADPARERLVRKLCAFPPTATSASSIAQVLRTGAATVLPALADELLRTSIDDPRELEIVRDLEPRSGLIVPLSSRDRVLGAISLFTATARPRYTEADLDVAGELASRAALAVDNARLYAASRRALRVRDEFLASASHELRTPLSHIKGFVSTLRQTDVEWDEATRQELLADTERETDRLAGLIRDVLDMTRLQSGGADRVRGQLSGRSVAVDVPDNLPPITADASQMERVIVNLVENAVKFSPPDRPIRLSGAVVDGTIELRVEDEGPGIPPDQLDLIFEKFYRIRTDSSPVPGTGLGLAICRRIVEAHGGHLSAENYDCGARFILRLPVDVYAKEVTK